MAIATDWEKWGRGPPSFVPLPRLANMALTGAMDSATTSVDFFKQLAYLREGAGSPEAGGALMTPALTDNRQRHVARSSQDSFDLDFETLQGMLDQELQAWEWRITQSLIDRQIAEQLADSPIFTSESPTSVLSPVKKEPISSAAVDATATATTAVATAAASNAAASKKLCRKCGRHKALEDFYKSKASADGRDGRCKACDAVHCRRRREKIPRVEKPTVEAKCCKRCGTRKSAKNFYRYTTNQDGLHNYCKACFKHDAARRRRQWHAASSPDSCSDESIQNFG